jgi:hypothetical protein
MRIAIRFAAISLLVLGWVATSVAKDKKQEPLATINFIVVRDENGKPIRDAAVVLHPVNDHGKQERGGLELKTDPDGKTSYEGVPYGKLRIQVLAHGFQTYGEDYDISEPSLDITVKMKRPAGQYSIYENHPAENPAPNKDQKSPDAAKPQ